MADEDQERFEDYIELERYIEELQTGKDASPPTDLTLEQAHIYQMAALFRSASPENAEPRLAFADQLKAQLLAMREPQPVVSEPVEQQHVEPVSQVQPLPTTMNSQTTLKRPVRFFSRRGLLTGGAIAAASLVIGVGTEHVIEQRITANDRDNSPPPQPSTQLDISSAIPTSWLFVTTLANLGQGAIRFASDALIGYVLRDNSATQSDQIIALSAACTHMGCIVQWKDTDRRFHCPCHTAFFAEDGTHIYLDYKLRLQPLPRLHTKVEAGNVYVEVPR